MSSKPSVSPRRRGRPPVYTVPASAGRVVKKYGNRRLYDTRESRYVNLEELMELFAEDQSLRVLDAATGEDLTERTLRQAVLTEEGASGQALMSAELLRAFLRYRRGTARAEFERHLSKAVAAFQVKRRGRR
jgi:polyhydroxyalkanoate synthesis repressor PhaR